MSSVRNLIVALIGAFRALFKTSSESQGQYLTRLRREFEAKEAERKARALAPTFAIRLQFTLKKRLDIPENERNISINGRHVLLRANDRHAAIRESDTLLLIARGFASADDAEVFGKALQRSIALGSLALNLGSDVGLYIQSRSFVHPELVKHQSGMDGFISKACAQGILVYREDINYIFVNISVGAIVTTKSEDILSLINQNFIKAAQIEDRYISAAALINAAMINVDPEAKIVLSIAAVEMLAESERWSPSQKDALSNVLNSTKDLSGLDAAELEEIVEAVRGLRNLGIGLKCRRFISSLGLAAMLPAWKDLYADRSSLVHGLRLMTRPDADGVATSARNLCAKIVLTAIDQEVAGLAARSDEIYPVA